MRKNLLSRTVLSGCLIAASVTAAAAQSIETSADGKAVSYSPASSSSFASANAFSSARLDDAQPRTPLLEDINLLPNGSQLLKGGNGFTSNAYGAFGGFPFTTRIVAQRPNSSTRIAPVDEKPYQQAGKLFMQFGDSFFVCSASVIRPGLVLTAAHCVHDYGSGAEGFADAVFFQPGRHNDAVPFGTWTAQSIIIPGVYLNGTDRCLPGAEGIVCENDIAILVMNAQADDEEGDVREVGDVVGRYGIYQRDQGYTAFGGDGELAAHLTQLGYPSAGYTGVRMIQNESVAVQDAAFALGPDTDYNQVIIGTNMTGGSSGGPWIHNFGKSDGYQGTRPVDAARNRVAAVTSWGFVNDSIKIQGASRFGHNTTFPEGGPTNIRSLINFGCSFGASKC